ncbi:MAG: DUF308 domain-containing protein [Emergencia sp.]
MKKNISKFAVSLVYVILGLALILKPTLVEDILCYLLAAAAIAVGLVRIISYMLMNVETRIIEDTNGLAVGLSLIILGIFILLKGTMIIILVPFILGFMITYKGVEGIQNAVNLKKYGIPAPKGALITAAVITCFGIVVMVNPFSTARVLFIMLGIGLVVSGLTDIVADAIFTRKVSKAKKAADSTM